MEREKVVVKLPKTFAEESMKRGSSYYDYENNVNVVPRYQSCQSATAVSTPASGRSGGANIPRSSRQSTSTTQKSVSSRC
jgi:hypothetical protein